jgi:hypothetical protein
VLGDPGQQRPRADPGTSWTLTPDMAMMAAIIGRQATPVHSAL